MEIDISPFDTASYFFNEEGKISNDPSELLIKEPIPNEGAIFSVLQFGAIIPPLSPWIGIQRLIPGYSYSDNQVRYPLSIDQPVFNSALSIDKISCIFENIIDRILENIIGDKPDPILLFSGGVDSGFLASRLAAKGYRNSMLVNYCFGDSDPESLLAEAMAKRLGLRFERFFPRKGICDCLIEPGKVYSLPFADPSVIPTFDFANQVVNRLSVENRIILDGTGADGVFGMVNKIEKWKQISRIPSSIKNIVSAPYTKILWYREGTIEHRFRIIRRSGTMPLLSAILALNPLADLFYDNNQANNVHALLEKWIDDLIEGSFTHKVIVADLALICANIFAQKARPIFNRAGFRVFYPFLNAELVGTALALLDIWKKNQPKIVLKHSLAKKIPRDMVFRPKSGFSNTDNSIFHDNHYIEHLRATIDSTGKIASLLYEKPIIKSCDLLSKKMILPNQTINCLWAITFLDRWYKTVF